MKRNIIFWVISLIFFLVYWNILQTIWNNLPLNTATNILALFIVAIINTPLSLISAEKTIKFLKKNL